MQPRSLLVLFVSALVTLSCGSGGGEDQLSGRIEIDGSSTVYPVSEAIAEEFRAEAPGVRVTVGLSGTGGGFKKFTRGETDINDASRQISASEQKLARENGVEYLELKVAFDGIAVVAHPENDWTDYVTVGELKTMWEPEAQENIDRWKDVRSSWPDRNLQLYGPGVASGTYDYFTEVIVGESGASRGDFTASEDDNVLVQGVAGDKNALGFFGLAYYEENSDKLRLVPVDDGDGNPVKPTLETVASNAYKPLSRPLSIYVRKKAVQREEVREFIDFYLDQAGKIAKDVGYVPMPDSLYEKEKEKFKAFHSASSTSSDLSDNTADKDS